MPTRPLADVAMARSGDKGDIVDISVFAPDDEVYALLVEQVTAARVAEHLGSLVQGEVARYEVPGVRALKFVCTQALGGGGPRSLRADNLGKALGGAVLRLPVTLADDLDARIGPPVRAPRDPYAGADWPLRADAGQR